MELTLDQERFLRSLVQEWRGPAARKRGAFSRQELHPFGQELGHDPAATERIARELEQSGALKDKAPDWEVLGVW